MRAAGQGVKPRRRFVRTTDSKHDLPVFPNLYRNVFRPRPTRCGWATSRTSVHPHRHRLLLPRGDPRRLQPQGGGLCDLEADRHAAHSRRVAQRRGQPSTAARHLHSSHRSRQPARVQPVLATLVRFIDCSRFWNSSAGDRQPRSSRGRLLITSATAARSFGP
jgi:hypothetical protein